MNLATAIRSALAAQPERRLLTLVGGSGAPRSTYTAAEIVAQADVWAARLHAAGVGPASVVALAPPRDETLLALHLGAMSCGATLVALNAALTPAELSAVLLACGATVIATSAALAAANKKTAAALRAPWWVVDAESGHVGPPFVEPATLGQARPPACAERAANDVALVLYTSGTTGRPKSVALTHANLAANLAALAAVWQRGAHDRLLHVLPAHHFHGLVLALYGSLLAANEIVLMPAFDARAAIEAIAAHSITLMMGVPTMYGRMLAAAREGDDLSSLRLAISGSAALGEKLWRSFAARWDVELVERYGLTETGIVAANAPGQVRAGSVGRALEGTRITLRTGDGYLGPSVAQQSPRGEICVSGPSLSPGYGNDAEATRQSFHHGRFHTGDLGHFDEDGYLWIDGRLKELIIVGGSNVVPAEIERVLQAVDGVAEAVVVGQADDDLGEVVVAYVVTDDTGVVHQELQSRCQGAAQASLARYKQPRRYFFVAELPRNSMGKVDRRRLSGDGPS